MFKSFFKLSSYLLVALLVSCANGSPSVDLFRAVNVDNASAVRQLLEKGFDPNSADERGQPPLVLAVREGSDKVFAVLLAHPRTQVDASNSHGETALMMAALRGRLDQVQALVARGAAVSGQGAPGGLAWTPLHYAVSADVDDDVAAWLLQRGAVVDARAPNGNTPLMMAARYGRESAARLLVTAGAQRQLRNDRGLQPSDFARTAGREALALWLAEPPGVGTASGTPQR
jgi:ankyrin repeat protein